MVQGDPHPIAKYRVIGPLSNLPEFQKAWSCKADARMVRPEGKGATCGDPSKVAPASRRLSRGRLALGAALPQTPGDLIHPARITNVSASRRFLLPRPSPIR
jgi:hypothetical protein